MQPFTVPGNDLRRAPSYLADYCVPVSGWAVTFGKFIPKITIFRDFGGCKLTF